MRHAFMEWLARELAASEMAMLRYQFPYMQQRRGRAGPTCVAHGHRARRQQDPKEPHVRPPESVEHYEQ